MGDHTEEWFRGRGPLAMAVVDEMRGCRRVRLRRGLEEEDGPVYSADTTSGTLVITDGPYVETKEFSGGFAVVDVADDEAAKMWAGKIAEACGWPHEVRRRFPPQPSGRERLQSSLAGVGRRLQARFQLIELDRRRRRRRIEAWMSR